MQIIPFDLLPQASTPVSLEADVALEPFPMLAAALRAGPFVRIG